MTNHKDNYPHSIEAPQRVYIQYSQDIPNFDYSDGKWPLGETYEGFIWEDYYIPVDHTYGNQTLSIHVWMRWRVGEKDNWTRPMRFQDETINIEATDTETTINGEVKFRFKYTFASGEVIYSEYITVRNGIDGRGITQAEIRGVDLFLSYTDNTEENLGRVVGYDGFGFPSFGSDTDGNIIHVDGGNQVWTPFIDVLDLNLSANTPIDYTNGLITHSNVDGYRHVPVGGSNGYVLQTDGLGVYTWRNLDDLTTGYIPWTALDDTATTGDLDKVYSADKILALVNAASVGIKYSVPLFTDLAAIPSPVTGELAVVTADPLYPNRPVYRWSGATWDFFFDLDAAHNHDDRYYTKTELNTSGAGGEVHWDNVTNKPASLFEDFTIAGDSGNVLVTDGATITFDGQNGLSFSISGNTVSLNGYVEGAGIDITGNSIAHENTSSVSNTANLNGTVLQNLTFDTYGHVLTRSSINLDSRYALTSHTHANLTPGTGLTGSVYNTSAARTFAIDFGTGTNQVARGDHDHSETPQQTAFVTGANGWTSTYQAKKIPFGSSDSLVALNTYFFRSGTQYLNRGDIIGYMPSGYRCRYSNADHACTLIVLGNSGTEFGRDGKIDAGTGAITYMDSNDVSDAVRVDINTVYLGQIY